MIQSAQNNFYYDECSSAFTTKKSLETHKKKYNEIIKCEKCKLTYEKENELNSHMREQHLEDNEDQNNTCKCKSESVCDPCVDYWVQKGQQKSK